MEFPYNSGGNLPLMLLDNSESSSMMAGLTKEEAIFSSNPLVLNAFLSVVD